jgi:hypothetical protein
MKKIWSFTAGVTLVFFTACKKDFLDAGNDPNRLTGYVSPGFVFTNALAQTVSNMVAQNELGSYYSGQWTYSNTGQYNTAIFAYQFGNTDFNFFDPAYDNLQDYQYVINNADAEKQPFLKGPAMIMKAMIFQQLVDLYGNIPYSQALEGLGNLTPEFDAQQEIYEDLVLLLDTAISLIKTNPAFSGTAISTDIVFGSNTTNTTNWIKFANTLKLRILMRQSGITGRETYIQSELQKAGTEGNGFLGMGQDVGVNPGYTASAGKQNPFFERFGYNLINPRINYFPRPTKYLVDALIATDDTSRLKRIAYARGGEHPTKPGISLHPEVPANYIGIPFGIRSGYTNDTSSSIGPAVIVRGQPDKPLYLMTAAEAYFLLAEAVQRYGTNGLPGTAQQYYEQGVRESFRLLWPADQQARATAAATALLNSGKEWADWNASPDKLKAIWMQKWLSFANFLGQEAWSEVRRTDWPPIPVSAGVPASQKPPVRLYYPASELGSNETNVNAQGTINVFDTRIFWDVK